VRQLAPGTYTARAQASALQQLLEAKIAPFEADSAFFADPTLAYAIPISISGPYRPLGFALFQAPRHFFFWDDAYSTPLEDSENGRSRKEEKTSPLAPWACAARAGNGGQQSPLTVEDKDSANPAARPNLALRSGMYRGPVGPE